jgi:transcriptional regulator with XRE-family HTH domain
MNIVGKNVHKYRMEQGLSLAGLGDKASWDKKNLYRLEQTGSGYTHESISRLAKALNVSLGALFDETGGLFSGRVVPIDFYTSDMISLDSKGNLEIERPKHEAGGISDVLITDGSFAEEAFAFTVNDDAMKPGLSSGDVVIVDPNLQPDPNDLVLAAIYRKNADKTQVMVRRYADRFDGFELLPMDNAYASEVSSGKNISIIGTVVEQRRHRRR